jgi:hypothetical protein
VARELEARGTLRIGEPRIRLDRLEGTRPIRRRGRSGRFRRGQLSRGVHGGQAHGPAAPRGSFGEPNGPLSADVVDLVVVRRDVVSARYPGGGADLFEGSFILRGRASLVDGIRVGDTVEIQSVGGIDCSGIESGFSVGPSVATAAQGGDTLDGYDASLGVSPFLPGARYARTLISLDNDLLRLQVLDGAPLSRTFQGVSCSETAQLVTADGLDPTRVYHLDGGQSSKLAFVRDGAPAVFGSMHYLLWPKQDEGDVPMARPQGRLLRSALRVSVHD